MCIPVFWHHLIPAVTFAWHHNSPPQSLFFNLNFTRVDLKFTISQISLSNSLISSVQAERNRPDQKQSPSASQNTHRKSRHEDLHIELCHPDWVEGQNKMFKPHHWNNTFKKWQKGECEPTWQPLAPVWPAAGLALCWRAGPSRGNTSATEWKLSAAKWRRPSGGSRSRMSETTGFFLFFYWLPWHFGLDQRPGQ